MQFPETAALADHLTAQNQALDNLRLAREKKQRDLMRLRVLLRLADYNWDQTVRSFSHAVEITEGGSRGALHRALFPNGISAVVTPTGASQVTTAKAMVDLLNASKAINVDKVRNEWQPRLTDALTKLTTAANDRDTATREVGLMRVNEEALREDHAVLVDKLAGEVRALFPKEPKRWEVIFPRLVSSTTSHDQDSATLDTLSQSDPQG